MADRQGDFGGRRERIRRWGWVSVGLGLPGVGLLWYATYLLVTGADLYLDVLFVLGAVLAIPAALGTHMLVTGWDGEDAAVDSIGSARARVGLGALGTVALAALGIVAITPSLCGCSSRSGAYVAAIKSDLKSVASQQEIYFSDNLAYSESVSALGFIGSSGVHVQIRASQSGWTARGWHEAFGPDLGCTLWWGVVPEKFHTGTGVTPPEPGEIVCDDFE